MTTFSRLLALPLVFVGACGVEPGGVADGNGERIALSTLEFRFDSTLGALTIEPIDVVEGGALDGVDEQALSAFFKVNISSADQDPATVDAGSLQVRNSATLGAGAPARSGFQSPGNPGFVAQGQPGVRDSCGGNVANGVWTFGLNIDSNLSADLANMALRIDASAPSGAGSGIAQFCHRFAATQLPAGSVPGGDGLAVYQLGPLDHLQTIDTVTANFAGDGTIAARFGAGGRNNFTFRGTLFGQLP